MALVGAVLEQAAVEFRHLARTEVREVEEEFTNGQKGSSAMPHKRNPWRFETLTGLARVLRGYAATALENVALWHERDISNSSVERIVFPDASQVLGLHAAPLRGSGRQAGRVSRADAREPRVVARARLQRHAAAAARGEGPRRAKTPTDLVQGHAMDTWEKGGHFQSRVLADPEIARVLSKEEIEHAFDLDASLRNVDAIFARTLGGTTMKALVHVTVKPDVLDPQGRAIQRGCASLG